MYSKRAALMAKHGWAKAPKEPTAPAAVRGAVQLAPACVHRSGEATSPGAFASCACESSEEEARRARPKRARPFNTAEDEQLLKRHGRDGVTFEELEVR